LKTYDLIVVGSGLAGLHAAQLGATFGNVLLLTKARVEDCNTNYAQGGIAAAWTDVDAPEVHLRDTMVAGDGLCDPDAVRVLVEEGPRRVRELVELGVPFDRANGQILVTREAAHTYPRILHAGGDATGAGIERTVAGRVVTSPRIDVRENCFVTDLIVRNGEVTGVRSFHPTSGEVANFRAGAVILATGGAGQLFSHTTNPPVATGDGIALAFRVGADIADMEFVQFHPTALLMPGAPRFLISEALRGEGGILRNSNGERFMERYDSRGELAPRDVVARSIAFEMARSGDTSAFLDMRHLGAEHVRSRFPTITRVCAEFGIDVGRQLIPVSPAAHFLMGGILTNAWGQTSLPGLYACGECACTGVHGANRLASNSLLETMVFSDRAVRHYFGRSRPEPDVASSTVAQHAETGVSMLATRRVEVTEQMASLTTGVGSEAIRDLMWTGAGLVRDAAGLARIEDTIAGWSPIATSAPTRESLEVGNLLTLGRLVATAALLRTESRGAHFRKDFPTPKREWQRRIVMRATAMVSSPIRPATTSIDIAASSGSR
jgi:L-aspartate oxidase